jgi:hypothetical protein
MNRLESFIEYESSQDTRRNCPGGSASNSANNLAAQTRGGDKVDPHDVFSRNVPIGNADHALLCRYAQTIYFAFVHISQGDPG